MLRPLRVPAGRPGFPSPRGVIRLPGPKHALEPVPSEERACPGKRAGRSRGPYLNACRVQDLADLKMKKSGTLKGALAGALCGVSLLIGGCGYQLDGFSSADSRAQSVLGDGSQTMKIERVEQVTMYPWVPYYLRGLVRDEVNLRRLAEWVDEGQADYLLTVTMPGFQVRSYVSNREDTTLLSDTTVRLELVVRSGKNGSVVWRSGVVSYNDKFETVDEDSAIREGLKEAVGRALDRMQQKF